MRGRTMGEPQRTKQSRLKYNKCALASMPARGQWVAHGKDIANTLWLPWTLTDMGRPWMNHMGSGNIMGNLMNEVLPLTRFSGFL